MQDSRLPRPKAENKGNGIPAQGESPMTQSILQIAFDIVETCPYTRKMTSAHKAVLAIMISEELSRYGQERYTAGCRDTVGVLPGPWAWDERGDKHSEWGLGTAYRLQDGVEVPIAGMFTDEGVLYDEYVCSHEAAIGNYKDPELITALRNLATSLIADWKQMRGEIGRLKGILRIEPRQLELRMSKNDYHVKRIIMDHELDRANARLLVGLNAEQMFAALSEAIKESKP